MLETAEKSKYTIDINKPLRLITEEEMYKYAEYLPPIDINYAYLESDVEASEYVNEPTIGYVTNDIRFGMNLKGYYYDSLGEDRDAGYDIRRIGASHTTKSAIEDQFKEIMENISKHLPEDYKNDRSGLDDDLRAIKLCIPEFSRWVSEHRTEESYAYSRYSSEICYAFKRLLKIAETYKDGDKIVCDGSWLPNTLEQRSRTFLDVLSQVENGNRKALDEYINDGGLDYNNFYNINVKSAYNNEYFEDNDYYDDDYDYAQYMNLEHQEIYISLIQKFQNPDVRQYILEKMAENQLKADNYRLFSPTEDFKDPITQSRREITPEELFENVKTLREAVIKEREALANTFPSMNCYDYGVVTEADIPPGLENNNEEFKALMYNSEPKVACVHGGIVVGVSTEPKVASAKNGEQLTINGIDITVLDHEAGLIALSEQIEEGCFNELYDRRHWDYYKGSVWQEECEELANKYSTKLSLVNSELPLSESMKEALRLNKDDYYDGPAFNQIITGETGCGKTYKAINDEIDAGRRFAYIAPCRQLAYESFRYYADGEKDTLSSGEIKINQNGNGNFFGVFESMHPGALSKYDTLIIDEAHFINDRERGGDLLNLIAECRERDVNIKLLTATPTFSLNDFERIELPAKFETPEKVEIDRAEAINNIEKGMQTIWFLSSRNETYECAEELESEGISAIAINADMTPSERLKAQIAFENKEVQVICSTNVLAQGVNFECENLIIEDDIHETEEQQQQKVGRLGRPGTLEGKNRVYYFIENKLRKPDCNPEEKTSIKKHESDRDFIEDDLENAKYEIENGYDLSYSEVKYCLSAFQEWANEYLKDPEIQESSRKAAKETLDMIEQEHRELKKTILSNMRNAPVLEQKRNPNESIIPAAIGGRHK